MMGEIYYQDEWATIYHGDCREVLPTLEPVDLLLTDPPYGVNADRDRKSQKHGWVDYGSTGWDKERPSIELIELCISKGSRAIVWGGNFFALAPRGGWLIWDKMQRDFSLSDCELAWTSENRASRVFSFSRSAALQDGKQHPTQKPLALMKWCIKQMLPCGSILDPFMGSGTTLRAAKDLGIKCVGVELEERYCEIAAKRLAQESFSFEPSPSPQFVQYTGWKQEGLLTHLEMKDVD
jgi:DNA modification methylase